MFDVDRAENLTRADVLAYEPPTMSSSVDESIVYNLERTVLERFRRRGYEPDDVTEFLDQHAPTWLERFAEDYPQAGFSGHHLRGVRLLAQAQSFIRYGDTAVGAVPDEDEAKFKATRARRAVKEVAEAHATLDVASTLLDEDHRISEARHELAAVTAKLESVLHAERDTIEPLEPELYGSDET